MGGVALSRTVISEKVNLLFSFASAAALFPRIELLGVESDVVLQFTKAVAIPLNFDQRLLRLRLLG